MYDKAFDCLKIMWEISVKEDEAATFNNFIKDLKKNFSQGEHSLFFFKLIENNLSLITTEESFRAGNVTIDDAAQFL